MIKLCSSLSIGGIFSNTRESGRSFLPALAAVAALFGTLLYLTALNNPFTYDDYRLIVENPSIDDLSNLRSVLLQDVKRPLVNLSYAIDTAIWGRAPFGYRLTNILLHAFNVTLLYWVALLACEDRRRQRGQYLDATVSPALAAFVTALLFAAHPMMTQAVAYISGRSDVAYASLFLLAFLAGRRWMLSGGLRWWIACVGLWASALLMKETSAMLPFVLMAYNWLVLDAPPAEKRRRMLAMGLPLIALTIAAGIGRIALLWFVEYRGVGIDRRYSLVAADAFWRYLGLFALPRNQALFHAMEMPDGNAPLRTVAAVVGLLTLPFAAWGLRRAQSVMAFGGVWFILLLAPSSILFALGVGEPLAEHRAYVAAAGLFLIWGCAFEMLWQRASRRESARILLTLIAALFVAQLAIRTVDRNLIWADPVELARESVALAPDHWIPRLLLGEALRQIGRYDDAIPEYRRAIELRPQEESLYTKLAGCLIQSHRFGEAETTMQQLKVLNPASQDATMSLGVLALLENDPDRARARFTEAADQFPELADARRMLAFVNGTLPPGEHRQLCNDLHGMTETFDIAACLTRQHGQAALAAPQASSPGR